MAATALFALDGSLDSGKRGFFCSNVDIDSGGNNEMPLVFLPPVLHDGSRSITMPREHLRLHRDKYHGSTKLKYMTFVTFSQLA